MRQLRSLLRDTTGQALAEYGLLLALGAVVALGALTLLGHSAGSGFHDVAGEVRY